MTGPNLAEALTTFDRVEVTLGRLEKVWDQLSEFTDGGISTMQDDRYTELCRSFADLAEGLPALDGFRITTRPLALEEIVQSRFDADEIGELDAHVAIETAIGAPGEEIAEYRHKFQRRRRELVRQRADELMVRVDGLLDGLAADHDESSRTVASDAAFSEVDLAWRELLRLLGHGELRGTRAADMSRHLRFGAGGDLYDIIRHDWPSVRPAIERALYSETEPLPVDVTDLGALVDSRPTGKVSTKLDFSGLDDAEFERLIFNLLMTTEGYENAAWLMETRAPDRGRDLSVERVTIDPLTGTTRERVIVQCKNWKKSLSPTECQAAVAPLKNWEPPRVDRLVIATTGRFSADGVQWVDRHNADGSRPTISMWPNSHLEALLAARGDLIVAFGLRQT